MALPVSDQLLERLMEEDVPYGDLTTKILGIGHKPGKIVFSTREPTVLCATEEAAGILKKFGAEIRLAKPSGEYLPEGVVFLEAEGTAAALHAGWRLALNLLEYVSGIATRTRRIVDIAKKINPDISIAPTRKSFPGTKKLAIKAVECAGARPHRLGLSESILIFKHHMAFLGGLESLCADIKRLRVEAPSMKLAIEVEDEAGALSAAKAGFDIIQVDKMASAGLIELIGKVRAINPTILIAAAGGVNEANTAEYAATGADILVLSSVFFGKTSDIGARIVPLP
ncbi:modD protein [Solidesulfovibrio fructosivorans JJ]]|uniref:Putative pyrophosphorylase ModD n=1 Tax=Solidesulfovibrio fructosivorans JJ] TaxID=596151 RepID=E1K1J8_SOLFR|nr:ModD protein [Solidesulfovibrio fructosivorans]EFL49492.1 modD protein [Solidesulfovibrio fructosivorans JJ]]